MKKFVRSIFLHSSPLLFLTWWCSSQGSNCINFGKHVVLRWGVPVIASTRKRFIKPYSNRTQVLCLQTPCAHWCLEKLQHSWPRRKGVRGNTEGKNENIWSRCWTVTTHEEEIAGHQQRVHMKWFFCSTTTPVALKSLQIGMMFKYWKPNEGQNRSKVSMSQHLSCFLPVNHLFLSFSFSVKKPPNKPAKKP